MSTGSSAGFRWWNIVKEKWDFEERKGSNQEDLHPSKPHHGKCEVIQKTVGR
jgi:hypothetical protein